jgi:manganese-dependent inorganic pyrophosphatase
VLGEPAPVYVTGHRNPDTDSIGAAIGYAELKRALEPGQVHIPVRLGNINPQTRWALEHSHAAEPELLNHVMLRAMDVMRREFPVAAAEDPVRKAGRLMAEHGLEVLPVTDDDGTLLGVLTERELARRYLRESLAASRLEAPTSVSVMAEVLDGRLLAGDADRRISGRVWVLAMDTGSMLQDVAEGDVAVVGDRADAQLRAVEVGISALVVSNSAPVSDEVYAAADRSGMAIISSPLDSYVAARMITLSNPCRALVDSSALTVTPDDLVGDISPDIRDAHYRAAVVVDDTRVPLGLITRADLVNPRARRVILVDHAEQAQSVAGIEQAEIVEILDHHHIGSIETRLPVTATFDPVGSTSTLVAERFRLHAVEPSRESALMLLAAILSDTVILNSPTTTGRDREALRWLADRVGVDPIQYGREMFEASSDVSGVAADELVGRDAKAYEAHGATLCIAQVETVGNGLMGRISELRIALEARCVAEGHRLMALMVTDVLTQGTELLVAGDVSLAERAFAQSANDGVIELPGVMSRKKQVAPPLLAQA